MDPLTAAALETVRGQTSVLRSIIEGLPGEALGWRPGPDTNSLAALVTHAWGAAQAWTARAAGEEIARDRESEFRTVASPAELIAQIDRGLERIERHLSHADPQRYADVWRGPRGGDTRTRAACLLHALEHTQEHVGQALLTRQLWEQRRPRERPSP